MTRARTAPPPQNLIIGSFVFLVAVVFAVAPIPILYRSLGILLATYAAFSFGGLPFAYAAALLAPVAGLLTGDPDWLVMLPLLLTSGLLGMLGLDYAWRYPALLVSPLLYLVPQLFVRVFSRRALFSVDLPWNPSAELWLGLHTLTALVGTLGAVYLDRRREGREARRRRP